MSSQQSILDRLAELDRRHDATTGEIRRLQEHSQRLEDKVLILQHDNMDLKKDVFNYQKENHELNKKIELMEKEMSLYVQNISGMKQTVSSMASCTDCTKKIDKLGKRITALVEKTGRLTKSNEDIIKDTKTVTSKVDSMESRVSQLVELQKILNRTLVNRQHEQEVDKKVDDLKRRTDSIEIRQGTISQSFMCVVLGKERDLITDRSLKLDKVLGVYVNRGLFDPMSCCLVPQCDGDYVIGLLFRQRGDGVIKIRLNGDGNGHLVGKTVCDDDMQCSVMCLSLKQGQKVSVEAWRCRGKATTTIVWCQFMCWMVG